MTKPKIFDDFPTVECNECERYYLNQCDANMPTNGSKMPCTAFIPVRGVSIPKELNRLKRAFKWQIGLYAVLVVSFIVHLVFQH
jgi:hypothetical protein